MIVRMLESRRVGGAIYTSGTSYYDLAPCLPKT